MDELESKNLPLIEFLSHVEKGDDFLIAKLWKEAKPHYRLAMEAHQESFDLSIPDIQAKLDFCEEAISLTYFSKKGEDFFNLGSWQNALSNYKKAISHHQKGFEKETEELKTKILVCGYGIRFEQNIDQAQGLYNQKLYADAAIFYRKALELYHVGFEPKRRQIVGIIEECREKVEEQGSQNNFLGMPMTMNKLTINVLLALAVVIPLIFFLYPPEPNFSLSQEELSAATIIDTTKNTKVSETANSKEVADTSNVPNVVPPIDSLVQFVSNKDSITKANPILVNNESFAIREPEEIQIPLREEEEVTPTELIETSSSSVDDTVSTEILPYEAGRVAVIPFCNGTEDLDFAKRLHLDASSAIRTSNPGSFTSVSKNSVKGAIQRLGFSSDNLCSEMEAIKVAQSLQVESIIVGNIIKLPDNQYRIICEVLHIPSRQYSREITLTDSDLDRLRRNLRQEIQQIFY